MSECEVTKVNAPKLDANPQLIVLTVEEAKKWMRILYENAPYLDCLYESSKDDYLFLEEISKRIEQVETQK